MSTCCKPRVQLLLTWAMDGGIVRCGIISSCQSAANFRDCKALLSTSASYVRNAIASRLPDFSPFLIGRIIVVSGAIYLWVDYGQSCSGSGDVAA